MLLRASASGSTTRANTWMLSSSWHQLTAPRVGTEGVGYAGVSQIGRDP